METNEGTLIAEKLLISTGRHANTGKLGLENVGVETDKSGAIVVNSMMETSTANIYAAGDCSNMPQFVYVAAAAGTCFCAGGPTTASSGFPTKSSKAPAKSSTMKRTFRR